MKQQTNEPTVKRFSKWVIFAHWTNAVAFFALYITALPLYTDFFHWLYPLLGGPENARLLHRIFAVIFILPPLLVLLFDPKSLFHWVKQTLTWRKNDFKFFLAFPKEFFGGKAKIPKQGFFNAGEKLNSLLTIICAILLIGSGVVMWAPGAFSTTVVQWAYPIHNIAFGLAMAVVVGHIFLSIGHPNSKPSMKGMTKGDVSVKYAKEHHGEWYDELVKEGKIKKDKGA
ncbi:cytochrome b/b6 domain-containing protein [Bacillus shivajii]|uniref:formate dehydrogenase subunit gamma n=1 Tax=Bacillus shivajii TaxID=1983719 RepID=UPI001CFBECAC|nr:cytochrome b/b6 domain-containing protein [Bacillus shivajii]UCZ52391.1 cytochrome b/b6 domain-containing protein [Bacillus shivajii]